MLKFAPQPKATAIDTKEKISTQRGEYRNDTLLSSLKTSMFSLTILYQRLKLTIQSKINTNVPSFHYLTLSHFGIETNKDRTHSYGSRLAIPSLEQLIEEKPDNKQAYLDLADIYLSLNREEAAIEIYSRMYAVFPDDLFPLNAQLNILLELGEFSEANTLANDNITAFDSSLLNSATYSKWISSLLKSPNFSQLNSKDFGELFFITFLARDLKAELRTIDTELVNQCYVDMVSLAQTYVEKAGGRFLFTSVDRVINIKNRSSSENEILKVERLVLLGKIDRKKWLASVPPHIKNSHKGLTHFSGDYWRKILFGPVNIIQGASLVVSDYSSTYVNVKHGRRITLSNPNTFKNRVFLFGTSDIYGTGCEDKHTIANYLQQSLLDTELVSNYCVENHGVRGALLPSIVLNLLNQTIRAGDVVIFYGFPKLEERELPELKQTHVSFSRPHSYGEIFNDESHLNWRGSKIVAETFLQQIVDNQSELNKKYKPNNPNAPEGHNKARTSLSFLKYLYHRNTTVTFECGGIESYCNFIKDNKFTDTGTRGSVSVNCNPITLGHLHLIEYAAEQVDYLYVFVIEEDLSFFRFQDRLRLVTESVEHLNNVKVLRGGRYICTQLTFPEYYSKETNHGTLADASEEAWYFCEHIAPALDITIIFLGNEPNCKITQQYNQQMSVLLKDYNIYVDIIPRISVKNKAISASEIRRLLKQSDFEQIKLLVPSCTYNFLMKKYGNLKSQD